MNPRVAKVSASSFASARFPDRTMLTRQEIATALRCSVRHVLDLLEDGSLGSINIATQGARIGCHRIPIESWLDYIATRFSGRARAEYLRRMPRQALQELHGEIGALLTNKITGARA